MPLAAFVVVVAFAGVQVACRAVVAGRSCDTGQTGSFFVAGFDRAEIVAAELTTRTSPRIDAITPTDKLAFETSRDWFSRGNCDPAILERYLA
jgi:hypothetical protein